MMLNYKKIMISLAIKKTRCWDYLQCVPYLNSYRNQGIATELVRRTLDHRTKFGFTLTVRVFVFLRGKDVKRGMLQKLC